MTSTPSTPSPLSAPSSTPTGSPRSGRTVLARGGPFGWRAVDLLTLAVLGIAFGVGFFGFDTFLYAPLEVALSGFPPLKELLLGVWLLPCVAGMLLVRRPGAALLCEFVAAIVEMLLGNQWGALVLLSATLQAGGVEVVAALFRWRRFGVVVAMLGGALAAVFEIVLYEWHVYVVEFSPLWKGIYLGAGVVSGLAAGVLGSLLVTALAATGAANAFPAGEEHVLAGAGGGDSFPDAAPDAAPDAFPDAR